jgi:pimeloyl-ACP methyl ester carboxylesterase
MSRVDHRTVTVEEFAHTFDALADLTAELLDQLGLDRYALYVQDHGAPVGWRLVLRHPERISAIVAQNGNGYEEGFVESFWADVRAYGADPGPATEPAVRATLGVDASRWQYLHGVAEPTLVSPDTWQHDVALVSREGTDEVQLALDSEVHRIDGGHFLLESHLHVVAGYVRGFPGRVLG